MKTFWLRIDGEPVAKGRPRSTVRYREDGSPFPQVYTPRKTATAEHVIWAEFKNRYPGAEAINEPFVLTLSFHEGVRRVEKEQDVDNMVKLVMDALNGHAWTDDRLCVSLTATVLRGAAKPHTEILVRTL